LGKDMVIHRCRCLYVVSLKTFFNFATSIQRSKKSHTFSIVREGPIKLNVQRYF
jgi:hypothetical protein